MGRKPKTEKPGYRELIPEYNNDQIIEILKKRKHYQPEAADLAVKEAAKRGLIHTEQDLFAPEFEDKPAEFTFFPLPAGKKHRDKLHRSVSRMLLFIGIIPFIAGFITLKEGDFTEGVLTGFFGLMWVIFAVLLYRRSSVLYIFIFYALGLISCIFVIYKLLNYAELNLTDIFVAIVFYIFLTYGLLMLHKINYK